MVQDEIRKLRRFVRDYTGGLGPHEIQAELGRDASRAWGVLTRDHVRDAEPRGLLARSWHRTRVAFLGLSSKLSPPRRILFAACILVAVVGVYQEQAEGAGFGSVPAAPLLVVSILGLVFLLALELADRVVVRDELEVARELQQGLLPRAAPDVDGYGFVFSSATANTIGGDYYDFLPVADGRLALVIGDASGHGIAAGLVMAIANATLQLALDLDPSPAAVAALVNRALFRTGGQRAFMTLFYGVLEPASGRLDYICAGHPYPILRHGNGDIEELGSGSLPLGLRLDAAPSIGQATVAPGDTLMLYTDGIPEALDPHGRSFGFETMRQLLEPGGSPREVYDRVVGSLRRFEAGTPAADDRSLVVIARDQQAEPDGERKDPGSD
jgi:hypothetical protein